jgi:hypothetical protein
MRIRRYDEATKAKDPAARREALAALSGFAHPLVADRILRVAVGREEEGLRAAAFRALGGQEGESTRLAPRVSAWLAAEAEEARRAVARGEFGFVVDRRTGDPILDTPEGKAALEAKRARGRVRAEAVALLRSWRFRRPDLLETAARFLQDGDDGLVVACLGLLGDAGDRDRLGAILDLYRMYPLPHRWETGAVTDRGGTNASAKSAWTSRFGDPDKRRARPEVVKALRETVKRITGEEADSPAALEAILDREPAGRGSRR